jgi:hypothetical protein
MHPLGESTHFLPPRFLYIHGNLDVAVDPLAYPPPSRTASLLSSPSNSRLNLPLWGVVRRYCDRLRLGNPKCAHCNPWHTYRFPTLQALTLRDIPLAGIALEQLRRELPGLILTLDSPLSGRLESFRFMYFVHLLAGVPRVE